MARTPSTPADHQRSEFWHNARLAALAVITLAVLGFGYWYFKDPIDYNAQRAAAIVVNSRPHVDRIDVVASNAPEKSARYAVTTDGKAVVIETSERKLDVVKDHDDLDQTKKLLAETQAQLSAMATKVTAAVKDSETAKAALTSLQSSIDKSTAMGKQYLDFVKGQATRASDTQSQNAAPAPEKPQASLGAPTKVADAGDTTLVVRKGFHVVSQGDDANAARAGACKPPHRLVVSNQCISAGYNDPVTHKPVQRCKNICE